MQGRNCIAPIYSTSKVVRGAHMIFIQGNGEPCQDFNADHISKVGGAIVTRWMES